MPHEILCAAWRNLLGIFCDRTMHFTHASHPEAFALLHIFRSRGTPPHLYGRFSSHGDRGLVILKAMRIAALFTAGILAQGHGRRPKAAKRYQEAIVLAGSYTPFVSIRRPRNSLDVWTWESVQAIRANLRSLICTDALHACVLGEPLVGRKAFRTLVLPYVREDDLGNTSVQATLVFATDACFFCHTRAAKLPKCDRCRTAKCA